MYYVDRKYFFDNFPFRPLKDVGVDTINKIIEHFEIDDGYQYLKELAYVFATAYHESTGTWNPSIREYGRGKNRKYGRPDSETGKIYYGRGLCQLTWKFNYQSFKKILGIDFVNDPDLALESKNSVDILMIGMRDGIFTNHKLSMYFDENTTNWVGARKIINGTDRANLIAGYAIKFYDALQYKEEKAEGDNPTDIEMPDESLATNEKNPPLKVEIDGVEHKAVV